MADGLESRLAQIRQKLAQASAAWGRAPKIIAVTKTVPAEAVNPLAELGVVDLGENRVQEMLAKLPLLDPKFRMHLIGRLQTNKVKYIINKVCLIHSLDRMELALEISRQAVKSGCAARALLQVNVAGETQKGGIPPCEAVPFLRECARLPGLSIRGLMAVMPLAQDAEGLRPLFREMRVLFDSLAREGMENVRMEELSMGMSQDYWIAAQEGTTMVRVGSALFGARGPAATNK